MKIVILMGGVGSRFAVAGYRHPKPLLKVDGQTMVEHVVSMYPPDNEFIFVCNENFAGDVGLRTLKERLPHSRIISIPSHKQGPVRSLSFVWGELPSNDSVLVSYCDFKANWDFKDFIQRVEHGDWDGAVPSYTGFHPHLIHQKKYAGIIADAGGRMENIQEKHCFTENPEDSFHSAGSYFFAKAGELKQYGESLIRSGNMVQGEYYLSMVYSYYLADKKNILVYPLKHFLQWGTPEDLEEYEAWSQLIQGEHKGLTDIPDARRSHVKIPYERQTHNYQKAMAYWKEYFTRQ